jgi:predicted nucleic acid-binding protein
MSKFILLDSTTLGLVSNPKATPANVACTLWAKSQIAKGIFVLVPEICDYEVRRELLRAGKKQGIANLDFIKVQFGYLPLTTPAMLKAAELWAQARRMGKPTAHNLRLDADVILAAQAALLIADGHDVTIATDNVAHLSLFVPAARWRDIS